jgi:solute carrier family 34 (sodium-dependent phosphate cotransporter)
MNARGRLEQMPGWAKGLLVAGALYLFLAGIGGMGAGFKAMGTDFTQELLAKRGAPLVSLFIGILGTTLVQSSSTSTSIAVALVATGAIPFQSAIYMVMGANVGTTVTNTIVSLGHITRSSEYQRAFAAATVHDFFNVIVLCVLFPVEVYTGVLDTLAEGCTAAFQGVGGLRLADPIKTVTAPAVKLLETATAATGAGGWLLVVASVGLTFLGLVTLVKALRVLVLEKLENLFDRLLFRTPYRALGFGVLLTVLVQSSSITTSVGVPLVGAGVLNIRQVFPYTMGANIGTTVTALLASLAAVAAAPPGLREQAVLGVTLAFHHVLFNLFGVALVWFVRELPVRMAEGFAALTMRSRLIPVVYIVVTFYVLPFTVVWLAG